MITKQHLKKVLKANDLWCESQEDTLDQSDQFLMDQNEESNGKKIGEWYSKLKTLDESDTEAKGHLRRV